MIKRLLPVIFLLILSGCMKEYDWKYKDDAPSLVVVDAILTDQPGTQVVKLRYSVSSLNEEPLPVTGATVVVSTGDSSYVLTEDTHTPGNYLTKPDFTAVLDKTYTLQVFLDGKNWSAKAKMAAGIEFDPLSYVKDDGSGLFRIDFVASAFEPDNPAMWEVTLDWSHVEGYSAADSLKNRARLLFYTLPTIDVTEIFAPGAESIKFPAGTIITETRYSLTPEHADFVRELLSETSWQGGLFVTIPSNVASNLSSGATGYFAVCGVKSLSFTATP